MADKITELPLLERLEWISDGERKLQDGFRLALYSKIDERIGTKGIRGAEDKYLAAAMVWTARCLERGRCADSYDPKVIIERDKLLRPICGKLRSGGEVTNQEKLALEEELDILTERVDVFLNNSETTDTEMVNMSPRIDWVAKVLGIKVERKLWGHTSENQETETIPKVFVKKEKESISEFEKKEIDAVINLLYIISPLSESAPLSTIYSTIATFLDRRMSRITAEDSSKRETVEEEKAEIIKEVKSNIPLKLKKILGDEMDWILGLDGFGGDKWKKIFEEKNENRKALCDEAIGVLDERVKRHNSIYGDEES